VPENVTPPLAKISFPAFSEAYHMLKGLRMDMNTALTQISDIKTQLTATRASLTKISDDADRQAMEISELKDLVAALGTQVPAALSDAITALMPVVVDVAAASVAIDAKVPDAP